MISAKHFKPVIDLLLKGETVPCGVTERNAVFYSPDKVHLFRDPNGKNGTISETLLADNFLIKDMIDDFYKTEDLLPMRPTGTLKLAGDATEFTSDNYDVRYMATKFVKLFPIGEYTYYYHPRNHLFYCVNINIGDLDGAVIELKIKQDEGEEKNG